MKPNQQASAPEETSAEPEEDADASHRIDPSAPSGFKLFGFGKKKKDARRRSGESCHLRSGFDRMHPAKAWLKKK